MADEFRVGPSYVFAGNPVTALGADMVFLGKTRGDVVINPQVEIAVGRADQIGVTPLADAVHYSGIRPVVTVPMVDQAKAILEKIFSNSNIEESGGLSAIGFGSGFRKIPRSAMNTLCILPVRDVADYAGTNGNEDPEAYWLPLTVARNYGQFTFNLPEGDDSLNPNEVQFAGLYTAVDQGDTAIPESMRVLFQGAPGAGGLSWNLPDLANLV